MKDKEKISAERIRPIKLTGRKILVAENDSANFMFLESFLKRANAEIFWARDGKQAVEIFQSKPAIDLVLMDIRMPNMNGIEATKIIRKTDQKVPVIALTAYAFNIDRENSLLAGCNEYLSKPVKIKVLSDIIDKYLSQY